MAVRTYVYIDGESHYIRSEKAWQQAHGAHVSLEQLRHVGQGDGDRPVLVLPKAKVFWSRKLSPGAQRAVYFTSAVGCQTSIHEIKVSLRNFGLESFLVTEPSQLAAQRRNLLNSQQLIEKPKGVDIALAVRMMHDAVHDAY